MPNKLTLAESDVQKKLMRRKWIAANGVWIALLVLILFNIITTKQFLTIQTLQTNLSQMATVGVCAVGMTFIMATGGIDLSVGSQMAIAGATAGIIILNAPKFNGIGAVIVIAICAAVASALCGVVNGVLVGTLKIQPIVATLGMMITLRGVAQFITNGRLFTVENPEILSLGRGSFLGISIMTWVMLIVVVIAIVIAKCTVFGREVVAVGGNEEAARIAGVPTTAVKYSVYIFAAVLASLAALMSVGVNGTVDTANIGSGYEFTVVAAVVIGGTSLTGGRPKIIGSIGGVALLQLLTFTLAAHNIPKDWSQIVQAIVIIFAVTVQLKKRR